MQDGIWTKRQPWKELRDNPAKVKDHPTLVQHSQYHTQGLRANGDISLILLKSSPENPSVEDIIPTEKYITGYACKGNEPTDAVVELLRMIRTGDLSLYGN